MVSGHGVIGWWCRLSVFVAALGISACGGSGRDNGSQIPPTQPPPTNPPPAAVVVEPAFQLLSFIQPVAMLQAPGDGSRWFVVEKRGVVRAFDAVGAASASDYLNIIGRVDSGANEGGLLGFAFDPDFASNGFVYASYTATGTPLRSIVSRFQLDAAAGVIDPASEVILLDLPQPATNHNGGDLAFGPDGFLYVGLGDGGGANDQFGNGQDTSTLLGAILRLEVDGAPPYGIPADNPFAGETECLGGSGTADCPEIFAWGFRNPWRFSFDSATGDLWVGDVGQGSWEEIDRVTLGQNYGWNDCEGSNAFPPTSPATPCTASSVDPVTEYAHGQGFSVTGGYVYRGDDFPGLRGQYLFGDFVTGRIWRIPASAAQGTAPTELAVTNLSISAFGQSNDGEVYVVDYSGDLYRIVDP